jgi:hypothetical protein
MNKDPDVALQKSSFHSSVRKDKKPCKECRNSGDECVDAINACAVHLNLLKV